MANNRQAFERLLSTIPNFDLFDNKVSASRVLEYYTALNRVSQSDLFIENLLDKRLMRVASTQAEYDSMFLKIKYIGKLVDELYDLKYQ